MAAAEATSGRIGNDDSRHGELLLFSDAVDAIERGLALQEERLGPTHPDVGRTRTSLAIALFQAGRTDEAVRAGTRAIAVFEPWAQRYPVDLAQALGNRGLMQRRAGELEAARDSFERALEVLGDVEGSGVSAKTGAMQNLGGTLAMLGDLEGAAKTLNDALAQAEQHLPQDHPDLDAIGASLAGVHLRREAWQDVASLACPIHERAHLRVGPGHRSTMIAAALCATGNEALGRHASVVETFATSDSLDAGDPSSDRAGLRFAVAKSLWEVGQRDRAVTLARLAAKDLAEDEDGLAEVEAWIEAAAP